ncbi:unnamed protein product [Parnassius apollo]|uniref:(apollo) hypothetical protein n=1 Tax=Parnassius apollo TaxID=110799 RepID=A0A8S3YEZ9_PARAO|nr:unnamed protein product [Parnassius apollo]
MSSAATLRWNSTVTLDRVAQLTPTDSAFQVKVNGKNRVALRPAVSEISRLKDFQDGGRLSGFSLDRNLKSYISRTADRRNASDGFP